MAIRRIDSVATKTRLKSGRLLEQAEVHIYIPYGAPGNGWFVGAYRIPTYAIFNFRSRTRTVSCD